MKGVFGMRRAHVRGKQEVHNDIGIMLMSMNLTKLAIEARRQAEASRSSSIKNIKCDEPIRILIGSSHFYYLGRLNSQPQYNNVIEVLSRCTLASYSMYLYGTFQSINQIMKLFWSRRHEKSTSQPVPVIN